MLDKYRCPLCSKTTKDYKDANLEREVEEFAYLRSTWIKCRDFKQVTTGIAKLDFILTLLWGAPHDRNWRDYTKTKREVCMDNGIVLRLVRV